MAAAALERMSGTAQAKLLPGRSIQALGGLARLLVLAVLLSSSALSLPDPRNQIVPNPDVSAIDVNGLTHGNQTKASVSQISTTVPLITSTEKSGGALVVPSLSPAALLQDVPDDNEDPNVDEEDDEEVLFSLNSSPATAKDIQDNGDYGDYEWTIRPRGHEPQETLEKDRDYMRIEQALKSLKTPSSNIVQDDSHFFFHLIIFGICIAILYITYHNK
ncbi:PREDICTED: keratinocyte-associated transmembrane protein 2-like, partial [Chrysochloris asiatica]|uniref:Keratinocyte-associated transmembrane protein 2-like n=1 Tax=Chrysochloris asiatica TaxID=185453 RepID=A0A9B0WPL9_CHRAS